MGETVQYKTPNGGNVSGYLATATGSTKHVVVIQEWWGLKAIPGKDITMLE